MTIARINEGALLSSGLDRQTVLALRHFLRQVGDRLGETTLPEAVSSLDSMNPIVAALQLADAAIRAQLTILDAEQTNLPAPDRAILRRLDDLQAEIERTNLLNADLRRAVEDMQSEGMPPIPTAIRHLKDYQEGSWTPVLLLGGASTGITYTTQTGAYTRIGNRVFYNARVGLSSKGSATGAVSIAGLPFASANVAGLANAATLFVNGVAATVTTPGANIAVNASAITLNCLTSGSNVQMTDADITNTTIFTVSGHYAV